MKYIKTFLILPAFLILFHQSNAQIGEGGIPPSFGNSSCISQSFVHYNYFFSSTIHGLAPHTSQNIASYLQFKAGLNFLFTNKTK